MFDEDFVPVPSNWFHFTLVIKGLHDGEGYEGYVDGNLETARSSQRSGSWNPWQNVSVLGAVISGNFYESLIADDLLVFPEALDQDHFQMLVHNTQ